MAARFVRMFVLAALLLLLPAFVYLSHRRSVAIFNRATGEMLADGSHVGSGKGAQTDQGRGPPPILPLEHFRSVASKLGPEKWVGPVKNAKSMWKDVQKNLKDKWPGAAKPTMRKANANVNDAALSKQWSSENDQTNEPPVQGAYAPKMSNATAKAELGRATWQFLHTMTMRFPENPTPQQSNDFKEFIRLFSLLYPCGDCAAHFQELLKHRPPQAGSRKNAALWLCGAHNIVNKRLGKPEFDCRQLNSTYDCGCGPSSETEALKTLNPAEATGIAHIMRTAA